MPYADPTSPAARECARRASRKYYQRNREKEIARSAAWSKANMERVKELAVERRSKKLPMEKVLYYNARNRAKAQGIEFSLTVEDIVVPSHCPVLGIELKVATGYAKPNSPSLDRIDPNKGYTKDNVQVLSHKANTMKSNGTIEDLERILAYMKERIGDG